MIPTYQQLMRPLLEMANNRNEIQLREASQDDKLMADDITPVETLRAVYKQINHSLADDILTRPRQVSPAFLNNC